MASEKSRLEGPVRHEAAPIFNRRGSSSIFTKGRLFFAVAAVVILGFFTHQHTSCMPASWNHDSPTNLSFEERASKILKETPLIDGHIDLPIYIRYLFNNHIYDGGKFAKLFEDGGLPMHLDLPRLRSGQSGGAFWSVFVECPKEGEDLSTENLAESVVKTLQQIDVMTRLKEAYPDVFSPMVNSSDALAAFKRGQLISPLGIEGLHQIGNSAANLRRFYDLGVRYCTLAHNCPNKYVDAALWENPLRKAPSKWGGVSKDGRKLINEMNRLGMIVDLSHTSAETQVDVLGGGKDWSGSKAPVIYSHSSAYALCPHPRNVPDEVLQLVKKTNSVVMVNFAPDFISCVEADNENGLPNFDPEHSTLEQLVKHIMHIGDLVGYDHVGIGSDFDGIETVPKGMEDVSKYPDLVAELLRNGVSDKDAAKIVGGNVLRVWKEVDAVALQMQEAGEPILEDDLADLTLPPEDAFAKHRASVQ